MNRITPLFLLLSFAVMFLTNAQNVGISDVLFTPQSPLHIYKTTDGNLLQLSSSTAANTGFQINMVGGINFNLINRQNGYLGFYTNNLERMRITNLGNVGIGTAAPTAQLHTTGTVRFANYPSGASGAIVRTDAGGNLGITNFTGSASDVLLGNNTFGPAVTSATAWQLLGNTGTNPAINFLGTTDNQPLVIRTNNTERIRVLSTGNTGIGTTTPVEQLHVGANIRAGGIVYWGPGGVRTETKNDAGLIGSRSGFFETSAPAPASNWPTGATNWWHLLDVRHSNTSNNYAMQFAGSFFNQELFFRKTNNNAAQPWTQIMTSASYASGISYDYSTASMNAPILTMGVITGMTRTLNLRAGDILYLHAHGGLMAAGINWGNVEFAIRVNGADLPNGGYTKVSVDYEVAWQAFANWAISGHYHVPADGTYTIAVYCGRYGGSGDVVVGGDNTTVTQGSLRIEIVRPNI